MPVNDSMLGSVLRSGRPMRMVQATDKPLIKISTGFLVYSILHVPLLSKGKAFGVLSVDNRSSQRAFNEGLITHGSIGVKYLREYFAAR